MKFGQPSTLPRWAQLTVLPLLNLIAALAITALVVWAIGEDPWECMKLLVGGAFGYGEGIGYTLFYTTGYIFTGLAVAAAFHAGLFNIGGEGQVYIAGLGVTLACYAFDGILPAPILIPITLIASMAFGAAWAYLPGYLQAKRGSHVVVTTIMFNYIAAALMGYLFNRVLMEKGGTNTATREFAQAAWMPSFQHMGSWFGLELPNTPLNASLFIALICCVLFWKVVWHSKWGFELRTTGTNEHAAKYAGISVSKVVIVAMCFSGALAGLAAVNEVLGSTHRMNMTFTNGIGFVGIAVALMGRNHPVGIVLSALLFGALTQGGLDLSLDKPNITREMIIFIQGLIILFCGALENLFEPFIAPLFKRKS
ncbi:ABC transporter permease [Leeia sp. TBRC 13508]|uniref:ABC transporter permease n=1 Tax=Leeia speluncae TaxID=2884804 RepID=A0ABS8D4V5_9NEIS|nr:ABC transporter permease [Leeia speluncae]MCB6182658.1 ABC transporter permease [Leeia speluncae]